MNPSGQAQVHAERTITERSRLLLEINNAIVSHLELAPLLKSISQCLRRELPHDFAGLAIYDPEIRQVVPPFWFLAGKACSPNRLEMDFCAGCAVCVEDAGCCAVSGHARNTLRRLVPRDFMNVSPSLAQSILLGLFNFQS